MSRDRSRLLLACARCPRRRAAARLPLAAEPDAVDVLRDGHGVPRLRRRGADDVAHADTTGTCTGARSVADLTAGTDRPADDVVDLVARRQTLKLASGRQVEDGYTLNGTSPGPLIEVTEGQLLEVRLANDNVSDGITLHWHGLDVPNAEDGVAGRHPGRRAAGRGAHLPVRGRAGRDATGTTPTRSPTSRCAGALRRAGRPSGRTDSDADDLDVVAVAHTYDGAHHAQRRRRPCASRPGPGSTCECAW